MAALSRSSTDARFAGALPDGVWSTIATTEMDLACCVAVGDVIYVGTDDARVLRVGADGGLEQLRGFDAVAGRETWYAGSAVINGQRVGPPLGIRSITATPDGAVLLANVHVGGIPRSTDGGATWQPTIDVDSDVHEVRAHPNRPGVVMAAAAIGLCTSRDGGVTWDVEQEGLHASYCSAVAFAGDDVLVSASVDHFAAQGAIYRRRVDGHGPLVAIAGGLPTWIEGIADTGCIAAQRLLSRARRSKGGQPVRISRHRPQLVASGRRSPNPEQYPHPIALSADDISIRDINYRFEPRDAAVGTTAGQPHPSETRRTDPRLITPLSAMSRRGFPPTMMRSPVFSMSPSRPRRRNA